MGKLKDVFIPNESNGYAPHALQRVAAVLMAVMIVVTFAMANIQSMIWIGSEWMVSTILPAVVVKETNQERSTSALVPLKRTAVLDYAATLKAQHMAQNGYFSHYSPDGVSPWYWFGVANYNFRHAGENLAVHFKDSSQLVDAWMDSPTHRANIMNGQYEEIGIGVAEGTYEGYDTVFVVQLFGTPTAGAVPNILGANDTEPKPDIEATGSQPVDITAPVSVEEPEPEPEPETESESVLALTEVPEESLETTDPAASEQVSGEEVIIEETTERRQEPVLVAQNDTEQAASLAAPEKEQSEAVESTEMAALEDKFADAAVATTTVPPVVSDSFIATSATPIAGVDSEPSATAGMTPSTLASLATKPATVMEMVYITLSFFVLVALFLSIMIEVRRQQPLQIAYALCLLTLMGGMWWLHTSLTNTVLIT